MRRISFVSRSTSSFCGDISLPIRERRGALRVWSAAASSGEEAYSIAMLLEDCLPGRPWEVVASDISATGARARPRRTLLDGANRPHSARLSAAVLPERARRAGGHHARGRSAAQQGALSTGQSQCAAAAAWNFDVIFLRNVLIYFNTETKRKVVARVLNTLKPGGYLLISHSES